MSRVTLRAFLILAGASAVLAPTVFAQNPLVCVFQQKQGHAEDSAAGTDATALAKELVARTTAAGTPLDIMPISGFGAKEIDAEAQHRNCAWVVTLWRQEVGPDTPNYAGTLNNTQATGSSGNSLMIKDNKAAGGGLLEYSLHKGDNHKSVAHGESDAASPYASFATAIQKKLAK
jgi:hypothetical protein